MVKNVKICVYERCSMILPKDRDPRFITIRRGGTLTDSDHHLLAIWAAICAEHVLPLLKSVRPDDLRPRQAIEAARAWTRGELKMMETRALGGHAMGTARFKWSSAFCHVCGWSGRSGCPCSSPRVGRCSLCHQSRASSRAQAVYARTCGAEG